jgi:hypothetical protein
VRHCSDAKVIALAIPLHTAAVFGDVFNHINKADVAVASFNCPLTP